MHIRDLPYPDPGRPDVRSGPRFLFWLGRNQLGGQVKAALWGLVHMAALVSFPIAIGFGVQAVVDRSGSRLAMSGALMVGLTVLTALGDAMLHRAAVTNWITAAARVQQLLARKAVELGSALTRKVAAGEVVAVSTGDVEKIGWFVEALSRFTAAAITTVAVCVALVLYQPALGVVVAVGVPALALAVLPLLPRAARRADEQREKAGRATELASDTVAGLRVLRGIGGEELFLGRYRHASQEVRVAAVRSARMWALIAAVQVALPGLLLIGVVWYGASLARDGRIEVGELVTVYSAVTFLLFPLRHFEEIAMAYSFSRPSARRAARVLALRRSSPGSESAATGDGGEGGEPQETTGDGGERGEAQETTGDGGERGEAQETTAPLGGDLYDPASGMLAPSGLLTAVVCGDPDAAGRLADRLGGHPTHDGPSDGDQAGAPSALLGGVALDGLPLTTARAAVLVQDKDPVLLSGALAELLDVPRSGEVSAEKALEAAQCGDVLDALAQASAAEGDDAGPMRTRITERGRSLSGGQRQRLALARSLVTDPEVLVLDEPTSAVDSHTEARIADGVRRLRAGRTTIVLTSSPLLLDRADRVVFVPDGAAAGVGTHRELLGTDPAYRAVVTRETEDEAAVRRAGRSAGPAGPGLEDIGRIEEQIEESA
ncbi:ABC transporter ATP-binding protein [Streptomyces sp. PSAA01]|uniref:ABC transporter transmembrane domain-containing protein n=1 Tax=Streptomyces sp. PSAA01 TaxID=2912762 RepID=UPI001F229550|nr:ABC transporter ATP-binding protein [Streptomyces sp. PSAA01]MCG0288557.1 ABC transporter ATP-binding protein/permease [Streptomyces sp. PSAA01]